MADAVTARWNGDKYQARVFWQNALSMLAPDSVVVEVTFEADAPKSFDDVVVRYDPPIPGSGPERVPMAYQQVKWHVETGGRFGYEDLVDPDFIGATRMSLLQRLSDAKKVAPVGARFDFVTTYRIKDNDPLSYVQSGTDKSILLGRLFDGTTDRSRMGKVRKLWREHLGLASDDELKEVVTGLRIMDGERSLEQLREDINVRAQIVGALSRSGADQWSALSAASESCGEKIGAPSSLKLTRPRSKAASQRADKSNPLWTSRRSALVSHSAHGMMCEARSSSGSAMPVSGQRPAQYAIRLSRNTSWPIRRTTSCSASVVRGRSRMRAWKAASGASGTVDAAIRVAGVPAATLLGAILDGRLCDRQRIVDAPGIVGLRLHRDAVAALFPPHPVTAHRFLAEAAEWLAIPHPAMTALLRDRPGGPFLPTCRVPVKGRRHVRAIPEAALDAFDRQYVTSRKLARERGVSGMSLTPQVERLGLTPALDPDLVGARFYHRHKLEAAVASLTLKPRHGRAAEASQPQTRQVALGEGGLHPTHIDDAEGREAVDAAR